MDGHDILAWAFLQAKEASISFLTGAYAVMFSCTSGFLQKSSSLNACSTAMAAL